MTSCNSEEVCAISGENKKFRDQEDAYSYIHSFAFLGERLFSCANYYILLGKQFNRKMLQTVAECRTCGY